MTFADMIGDLPIIAILRGLTPGEAEPIGAALVASGLRCLEVPLNSPDPFTTIRVLVENFGDQAIIGAGTVLAPHDVRRLADVGGRIAISPNCNPSVIRAAKALSMISLPAFFTPTEAFTAIEAGADALKLFPAEAAGPSALQAMRAVLPQALPIFPVGGIDEMNMKHYIAAGSSGFGIGTKLFTPGRSAAEVGDRCAALVAAFRTAKVAAGT